MQVRLHGGLDPFSDSLVTQLYYSAEDDSLAEKINLRIRAILEKHLFSSVWGATYGQSFSTHTPSLVDITRYHAHASNYMFAERDNPVIRDIKQGNYTSLLEVYLDTPNAFPITYINKNDLKEVTFEKFPLKCSLEGLQKEEIVHLKETYLNDLLFSDYTSFQSFFQTVRLFKYLFKDTKEQILNILLKIIMCKEER